MPFEKLSQDPHPECEHKWIAKGWTTICEPPIAHSVCFRCRTFKYVKDPGGKVAKAYGFDIPEEIWFTKEWIVGPWDWDKESR